MAYESPDVTVRQVFENINPALNAPFLNLCLIGICNQAERQRIAGNYTRGTSLTVSYPNLQPGAIVDQQSVVVELENDFGLFDITGEPGVTVTGDDVSLPANINLERSLLGEDSVTGASNGIILTDPNVDFLNAGAVPGVTEVEIKSPLGNFGTYVIDRIIDAHTVRIFDKSASPTGYLKQDAFSSAYAGSVITAANIAVLDDAVVSQQNFQSEIQQNSTIVEHPNIGVGTQVGDFLRVTIAPPVIPSAWSGLAVSSLVADNGSGQGEVVLTSQVTAFESEMPTSGDRITLSGTANGNDGTYIVDSFDGVDSFTLTAILPGTNETGGSATATIQDVSRGGTGSTAADPSVGGYRIVAVIDDDTIQLAAPGLLGNIDGTDFVRSDISITEIVADNGSGEAEVTLDTAPPSSFGSGDLLHISGSGVGNDGIWEVQSVSGSVVTLAVALSFDDTSASGTANLQDVDSARVDQLRVARCVKPAVDSENRSGDFLVVTSGSAQGEYELVGTAPNQIILRSSLAASTQATDTFKFMRGIPYRSVNNTYNVIRIESNTYSASVLVTYVARRRDLSAANRPSGSAMLEIIDEDDRQAKLGDAIPENPLGLAAQIALRNTNNIIFVLGIDEDSVSQHQSALAALESEEAYCLVPLTQDLTNMELYPVHCEIMSAEREKRERICLLNRDLFIQDQKFPANNSTVWPTDGETDATGLTFTSSSAFFVTAGVQQGDEIEVLDSSDNVESVHRIVSVVDENTVDLLDSPGSVMTGIRFRVMTHPLTKLGQAEFIADYARSVRNRRAYLTWPPLASITYANTFRGDGSNSTEQLPGYYITAAVGGMVTEQLPQQPFTNLPMIGVGELFFSNRYFRPSIMDRLAAGGVYILVQETVDSLPYARHQLSTDMTAIETRELSITKDIDYSAKYFRNNLRPYIGRFNITDEYLRQVKGAANSIIRQLVRNGQAMPGTTIRRLIQDPNQPDSVIIDIDFRVPYPANFIRVTLYI